LPNASPSNNAKRRLERLRDRGRSSGVGA